MSRNVWDLSNSGGFHALQYEDTIMSVYLRYQIPSNVFDLESGILTSDGEVSVDLLPRACFCSSSSVSGKRSTAMVVVLISRFCSCA